MVCIPKYLPHPTSGYIHFTMQSDLSVALPESSGSGVVPTGTTPGPTKDRPEEPDEGVRNNRNIRSGEGARQRGST
jgi:hypothetical protein